MELAETAVGVSSAVQFAWVGPIDEHDPMLFEARDRASRLSNTTIVGFVDDPSPWFAAADLHVLVSREDPFPSVVLEAAACGIPTIALRGATGMEQCIVDLGGEIVDDDAPEPILATIARLLGRPAEDARLRQARLRERIVSDYDFGQYVLDLLAMTPSALPRISVLVPAFRHEQFVAARIQSILAQTSPLYEVVVIDDASPDGTFATAVDALAAAGCAWSATRNAENSGLVWNQWRACLERAAGDYVWIAESDDLADPDFLAALVAQLDATGANLAFCQARPISEDGSALGPSYRDYLERFLPEVDWTVPQLFDGNDFIAYAAAVMNPILTVSSVLARRSSMLEAITTVWPELQERPTTGDWLVYAEMARRGDVAYVSEVLCSHRRHSSSVIGSADTSDHAAEIEGTQGLIATFSPGGAEAHHRALRYRQTLFDSAEG